MRVSVNQGLWIHYTSGATPVETIDRVAYSFMNEARECLVTIPHHIDYLLSMGGRYCVVGVEIDGPSVPPPSVAPPTPLGRGRPKGRPRRA